MMLGKHVIASGLTSAFFLFLTKSWGGAIACFVSGILIDLDHLLDYCIIKKRMCWSLDTLKAFCTDKTGKIYLVLHSYELMIILWAAMIYLKATGIWLGLLYGMSVHILLDQLTNPIYPLAYFWFYRLKLGFPKVVFFNDEPLGGFGKTRSS